MTMDDTSAKKVAQEINAHDGNQRFQAYNTLSSVSHDDFKKAVAAVDKSIDKNALGLQGFHLDHVGHIDTQPDPAHNIPNERAIPYFAFTDAQGHERDMFMLGSVYDMQTQQKVRGTDAPPVAIDTGAKPAATDSTTAATTPAATDSTTAAAAQPTTDTAGHPLDAAAQADRAKVQQFLQAQVDQAAVSSPVQRGEGYWQVLHRMYPQMSTDDLNKQAHAIKQLNGSANVLKVGQTLKLMSDDQKTAALQQQLAQYDQLSPADKAKLVAQAKQAIPDTAATTPAATDSTTAATTPAATDSTTAATTPAATDSTTAATTPAATDSTTAATTPAATDSTTAATTPAATDSTTAATTPAATDSTTAATTPAATDNSLLQPTVDVTSAALNPTKIKPDGAGDDQTNLAYNPLAPLGLTEGKPGQNLDKSTAGTADRTVTKSQDGTSETISGKLDDNGWWHMQKPDGSGLDWNPSDTKFTTQDKFNAQGMLTDRTTTYSRGINMHFQLPNGGNQEIDGVTKVATTFANGLYTTNVTDGAGKVHQFTSDATGAVTAYADAQGPS
jgi:hypothetical protein